MRGSGSQNLARDNNMVRCNDMKMNPWLKKFLVFLAFSALPASFGAGYKFHQWSIEKSNVDVIVKDSYITKGELTNNYISLTELKKHYVLKEYVSSNYTSNSKYNDLEREIILLKNNTEEVSLDINEERWMSPGEHWEIKEVKFSIEILNIVGMGNDLSAVVAVKLPNSSKPARVEVYPTQTWFFKVKNRQYKAVAAIAYEPKVFVKVKISKV